MSWIKENKFTAALAGVTLVGSVALIALTSQKSGEYDTSAVQLKKALKKEADLQGQVPFPSSQNLESKKANVAAYMASADELQTMFAAYRPTTEEMADLAPTEFSKMVNGYRARLDEKFAAAGTKVPQTAVYGFDAYASKLPKPEATGELRYQMSAFEWLFSTLSEHSPEALINVHRPKLAIESDALVETSKKKKRSKRSKKSKKGVKSAPKGEPIYDKMPLELSFRCTEQQLKSFLEDIANSPKYFMAIRALRVQNERLTPPNDGDVKFDSQDDFAADSGFGGFAEFEAEAVVEAEEEVADAVEVASTVASDSDTTLALQQVLGAEKIYVFIKLDLLAFKPGDESAVKGSN